MHLERKSVSSIGHAAFAESMRASCFARQTPNRFEGWIGYVILPPGSTMPRAHNAARPEERVTQLPFTYPLRVPRARHAARPEERVTQLLFIYPLRVPRARHAARPEERAMQLPLPSGPTSAWRSSS